MPRLEPRAKHNIALHIIDGSLFMSGMVFFETTTIMVAYVKQIYDNPFFVGAIPSLLTIGFNVPGIVSSIFAERFKKRRAFIGVFATLQRLSVLGLSLSTFVIGVFSPPGTAMIVLFFFFLFPFFGGISTPAWLDFVGKTIPATHRARAQAFRNFISSIGGILLPAIIAQIFLANGFPANYRISFFLGFVFIALSLMAFFLIREDRDSPVEEARSIGSYFGTLARIVRENRNFMRLLLSRVVLGFAASGGAFYTAYSIDYFGRVDNGLVILYAFVLNLGKAGSSLVFGFIGDRFGNLIVQRIGALALALSLVAAFLFPHPITFIVIFALFAVSVMADLNCGQVLITEFGDDRDRIYYSAVFSSITGITWGVVPLAGGALLALGCIDYRGLFALSALFALTALLLYTIAVKDPKAVSKRLYSRA